MAVGDVVNGLSSVAANAYLNIQPASGVEWAIHNIYHEGDIEIYLTDGTNYLLFDVDRGRGVYSPTVFHVTNAIYIAVKNIESAAQLIGYDGVQTK